MVREITEGMQVGRYRLVRRLATGGMGTVWIGRDETLAREVAVKLLPRIFVTDAAAEQRFRREARAMGRLQHPNVVSIYDVGSADPGYGEEIPFLVMELIRGESLDRIVKDGPLLPGRAARIGVQVARALGAAHRAGVVHRDLKPSNIMISAEGHAKVLDFGLARLVQAGGHSSEATLTVPGMVLGSCPYMAPEQALGRHVGAQADIFSFGTVLYEMVCGQRAFTGTTPVQVLQAVIKCRYPKIDEVSEEIPPALGAIIDRCLEKEPARRYRDAEALVRDLEAFLEDPAARKKQTSTASGRRSGSGTIEALTRRRRRRILGLGTAGAAVLLIGAVVGFFGGRRGMEPLRPDPGRWQKRILFSGSGSIRHLAWNPSGNELAAQMQRGADFKIAVFGLDGRRSRVVAVGDDAGLPMWPAFSSDGRAMAITRMMPDSSMSVEVIPSVGGSSVASLENASHGRWIGQDELVVARIVDGVSTLWKWETSSGRTETFPVPDSGRQYWEAFPRPGGGGTAFLVGPNDMQSGLVVTDGRSDVDEWLHGGRLLQGVSWHPSGRSLVASVDRHLMRIGSKGWAYITAPLLRLENPAFDSSGTRLAAVRRDSAYDILAVDPMTGDLRCVLCGEPDLGWGSVGPSGSVFCRRADLLGTTIFRFEPDGAEAVRVEGADFGSSCPVVSPDGERVAFLAWNRETKHNELRVLSLSGGEPVTLAVGVEGSEFPSWSPDGRFIAFAAGDPLRVHVVSSAGGTVRTIGPPGGDYPVWSPSGRWVAFTVWTDPSDPAQGIWKVSPDRGDPVRIGSSPTRVAWSRDGMTLFQLRREEDAIVLYRLDAVDRIDDTHHWRRGAQMALDGPAPEHFEFQPLTVDPTTGELILNRQKNQSKLVVFEEIDPVRW